MTVDDGTFLDYETSPTETITVRATDTVTSQTVDGTPSTGPYPINVRVTRPTGMVNYTVTIT